MLKNSKSKIVGAGSLNIQTCKNYRELVTANFELNFLLNFLGIRKKKFKNNQVIWMKRKNNKNPTSWQENECPRKKKVKGKCVCCFDSKFVL